MAAVRLRRWLSTMNRVLLELHLGEIAFSTAPSWYAFLAQHIFFLIGRWCGLVISGGFCGVLRVDCGWRLLDPLGV
jgi:hypothetical protein